MMIIRLAKLSAYILTILILAPIKAFASPVCAVCTVAVAGGLGLSRWLGIDDVISGVWIGAIFVILSLLTIHWLNKKKIAFTGMAWIVFVVYYTSLIIPLYIKDIIGHPGNLLWGIDKLILGIIFGSALFGFGVWLSMFMKKKNNDKVYFPFQKVAVPVIPLVILSAVFYYITN